MNTSTRTARRPFRAAITSAGLTPTKRCDVRPLHGYYFGGSSSPSFVIVLAVTDDTVTYCDTYKLEPRREQRWIFEDLAATAGETIRRDAERLASATKSADANTAMGRLMIANAKHAAEQCADHGAPVTPADHDRVRVSVTRDEDAYSADRYGVLVNYSEDTNTATIETARSVLRVMGEAGFRILSTETIKACPTA